MAFHFSKSEFTSMCMQTEDLKGVSDLLELELYMVVSCLVWVLGTKLGPQ